MDKRKLTDLITFSFIAIVAALFGFSDTSVTTVMFGRVICYISTVLALLSLVVKRPLPGAR